MFSSTGDFEVAGAGVYLPAAEVAFESAVWGVAEEYGDARLERRRVFVPVPWGSADCPACRVLGCHCCLAGVLALPFVY